jgi:hypothetical protein
MGKAVRRSRGMNTSSEFRFRSLAMAGAGIGLSFGSIDTHTRFAEGKDEKEEKEALFDVIHQSFVCPIVKLFNLFSLLIIWF